MKRIKLIFISVCLIALVALTLVSCGSQLSDPSGLVFDVETQTLHWNAVKGAKYYTIQISEDTREITTKANYISLESLDPGNYQIKIRANGDGGAIDDSDWIVYDFERVYESGLKYQLINNDTEYALVGGGSATGDVVMEDYYRGKPVTKIADKALYHNPKITSFVVGKNVKTIGEKAFTKCTALVSVTIPEGVVSIGQYAFQSCKALKAITLPNSVTELSPYLFSWCSALEQVTLGSALTQIGEYAFANCEAMTQLTYSGNSNTAYPAVLPDTLRLVGPYAFSDCTALTGISLGKNVTAIGEHAFDKMLALTQVDLGESLLAIGEYAFYACKSLTSVVIPNTTESLANATFADCEALANVTIGTGMKSIGANVFRNTAIWSSAKDMLIIDGWLISILDPAVEKISITENVYGIASNAAVLHKTLIQADFKGVKYVGQQAFAGCEVLYRVTFDDALLQIDDYAFMQSPFLAKVTVGNSLKSIGTYAFYACEKLMEMTLPKTVTSIGTRAFRDTGVYKNTKDKVVVVSDWVVDCNNKGLEADIGGQIITLPPQPFKLVVPEGTRCIANYAFSGASLSGCELPDTLEYIGRGAFYNVQVSSVKLPKSLKYVGDYAFYGCQQTNFGGPDSYDLTLPEGTEYVGRSAFYNCGYIVSLIVPGSVKTIGPYAFYGCALMGGKVQYQKPAVDENGKQTLVTGTIEGKVVLSEGLESIGERAFQGCTYLAEVIIPNSVTSLGNRVFYKCQNLKNITLGSGITAINDYMFYKCEALETVTVSNQLESIGNYAFRGCVSLKEFDLKNVKSIGRYAFYGCSALTSVVMSDSLDSIGDYAFRGCNAVTAFMVPNSVANIGKHVFYGLNNTTLYCESEQIMPYWDSRANSSYRPVFWGCTLSEDNSYVISFVMNKETLVNAKAVNGISNPTRNGYTFVGWATEQGSTTVAYTSENVSEAANGTVLYAVWTEQINDNQEEVQE